jgi:hypothetical protein
MGFTMPRPLPPLPFTYRGLLEQHAVTFRRMPRRAPADSEIRGRPYNWRRDGI